MIMDTFSQQKIDTIITTIYFYSYRNTYQHIHLSEVFTQRQWGFEEMRIRHDRVEGNFNQSTL